MPKKIPATDWRVANARGELRRAEFVDAFGIGRAIGGMYLRSCRLR
jgi:hypothetical protein